MVSLGDLLPMQCFLNDLLTVAFGLVFRRRTLNRGVILNFNYFVLAYFDRLVKPVNEVGVVCSVVQEDKVRLGRVLQVFLCLNRFGTYSNFAESRVSILRNAQICLGLSQVVNHFIFTFFGSDPRGFLNNETILGVGAG